MRTYVQPGDKLTIIATAAIAAGAGIKVGGFVGIAQNSAAIGAALTIQLVGVHQVAKAANQAWTVGQLIYWDDTAKVFTNVSTSNTLVGAAWEAAVSAASGDGIIGKVKLTGAIAQ